MMATPLGKRLIVIATFAAMLAALLLLGGFTWVFAQRLPTLRLALCLLALLAIVGMVWGVIMLRIAGQHAPRYSGQRAVLLKPGAPYVVILFAAAMVAWMVHANLQEASDPSYRVHWIVQLALLLAVSGTLFWRFSDVRKRASQEETFAAEDNIRKREKIFEDMQGLAANGWFGQFGTGTTGARLQATVKWWIEEFQLCVPENGYVMAESFITHFLEDARRQFTFIDDIRQRNDRREDVLQEAEVRTMEFINRTGRLARRTD
jgi:hypothetical protein